VHQDQTVAEMAQEALMRQVRALAQSSGHTLEVARQAVVDTEAGRQLRDLAQGEHRHEKAKQWQASIFWERAEERFMHQIGSEALPRFAAGRFTCG
jgi:ribonuclease D